MNGRVDKILRELKSELAELYGPRLKGVYLFGSHAREEADEESDVDVLIVLDEVINYSGEIDRTGEIISELSLEHGVSISRVFSSELQWREEDSMFLANVRDEAVQV